MTHVHPTEDDPVVRSLSDRVGGPMGELAGPHWWWTPARVVLVLAALCLALGMVQKAGCLDGDAPGGTYRYSHMCYSDLPPLYSLRGFAEHAWPYSGDEVVRDRYDVMEYPVGISYWAWGTAWVTHWLNGSPDLSERYDTPSEQVSGLPAVQDEVVVFTVVNAIGMAAIGILAAWLLTLVNPRRPWDAAIFAASPTLALTWLINWDLLAVVFVAGALWAWSRDRPVATGVLIGLGVATKLYPLFLLGGLLVICWRRRRLLTFAQVSVWAAVAWALANLPALLTGREQWRVFWSFNSERLADLGSVWLMLQQITDHTFTASTINNWSWGFFGVWCLAVLVIGLRAPQTPRLAQLGFLIVAGFLLVNKVYSPQYVLWLLPLAALARPRWRDQIIWQAGELFYFCSVWWYLGGFLAPSSGDDAGFYWLAIVVRMGCELYLVGLVTRDVLRPSYDVVEREPVERPDQTGTLSARV